MQNYSITLSQMITEVHRLKTPIVIARPCKKSNGELIDDTRCGPDNTTCSETGYCLDLDVPEKYSEQCSVDGKVMYPAGPGSNSDLLLFVTVENLKELANAVPCQHETDYNRRTAGRIVLSSKLLTNRMPVNRLKNVIMHELYHILMYPLIGDYYRIPGYEIFHYKETYVRVRQPWMTPNGVFEREAVLLTLPSVVDYVRKHFNCPSLLGAELYNWSESLVYVRLTVYVFICHYQLQLQYISAPTRTSAEGFLISIIDCFPML